MLANSEHSDLIDILIKKTQINKAKTSREKRIFSVKNKNEQTCINSTATNRPIREKQYFSNLNTKYSQNLMKYPGLKSTENALELLNPKVIVMQIQCKQFTYPELSPYN